MTPLRILAFGDLAGDTWGVSWVMEGGDRARLAVRANTAAAVFEVELSEAADGGWQLEGDGALLRFRPAGATIVSHDVDQRLERRDELCQVGGTFRIDDRDTDVDCLGWTSWAEGDPGFDSARFVAAWLDPVAGFSLTALRPRKARGHEADLVAAAVVGDPPPRVVDPRLSTTYTDDGAPGRAGLELWLEPEDQENAGDEAPLQYPRRAAGEAAGATIDWDQGDLALHASPLRWHSHGREGAGVYVLGQHR